MKFGTIELSNRSKNEISSVVEGKRTPHALLLTGGNVSIRKATAKLIASALLCSADAEKPCNKCSNCKKIKAEVHPDIWEISGNDKLRSIKKEAVTELQRQAYLLPNEADKRVIIILEANGMTQEAQNAILKILEEPPRFSCFVLACNMKEALLPTILSRTVALNLGEAGGTKNDKKADKKAYEIALGILENLTAVNEFDLMVKTAPIEKDRQLLKKSCESMMIMLWDVLKIQSEKDFLAVSPSDAFDVLRTLAKKLRAAQVFDVIEVLKIITQDADRNANENLLVTRLVIELRRAIGY